MSSTLTFILNSTLITVTENPAVTALDFIRKSRGLTGTKEGCREGDCGACTILLGELHNGSVHYTSVNSCLLPLFALNGKHAVTIEGLNTTTLTPVQDAFLQEAATQCGYCTPGFLVSLTGYLLTEASPDIAGAIDALGGNVCRCTGHTTIKRATEKVVAAAGGVAGNVPALVGAGILPEYFTGIQARLATLQAPEPPAAAAPTVAISGGTDLYVQRGEEIEDLPARFFTPRQYTATENGVVVLPASLSVAAFLASAEVRAAVSGIEAAVPLFGSLPIRNRATLAGNIVNGSPIGDMASILLALDAQLGVGETSDERFVPLRSFYTGYKQNVLRTGESINSIRFAVPLKGSFFNFEKVSKRTHLDIASVNSSALLRAESGVITVASFSAGGVAPVPLYLAAASACAVGKPPGTETMLECMRVAETEAAPISDARGSAAYKRLLLRQLIAAHFSAARMVTINREVLV